MRERNRILLCESARELEPLLAAELEERGYSLIVTSNPRAVVLLAREHAPVLIIINHAAPLAVCHEIKMNPALYEIPVFVVGGDDPKSEELRFLANEFFDSPPNKRLLLDTLARYRERSEKTKPQHPKSENRDRWIEVRNQSAYLFVFKGLLAPECLDSLAARIAELVTVGRTDFTINLTAASNMEGLSPMPFIRMHELARSSKARIRLVMPACQLASELMTHGLTVDEYLPAAGLSPKQACPEIPR